MCRHYEDADGRRASEEQSRRRRSSANWLLAVMKLATPGDGRRNSQAGGDNKVGNYYG